MTIREQIAAWLKGEHIRPNQRNPKFKFTIRWDIKRIERDHILPPAGTHPFAEKPNWGGVSVIKTDDDTLPYPLEYAKTIGTEYQTEDGAVHFASFELDLVSAEHPDGQPQEVLDRLVTKLSLLPCTHISTSGGGQGIHVHIPLANPPVVACNRSGADGTRAVSDRMLAILAKRIDEPNLSSLVCQRGSVMDEYRYNAPPTAFKLIKAATIPFGGPIDISYTPPESKEITRVSPTSDWFEDFDKPKTNDKQRALDAIAKLRPGRADSLLDWLAVGQALHWIDPNDNELLQAWDTFSKRCPAKYKPGHCKARWNGFKRDGGTTIGRVLTMANEDLPSSQHTLSQVAPKKRERYTITSAFDFLRDARPADYLVKGVMVVGESLLIAGRDKHLKTSITMDLVVSLISGTAFLGRFPVTRPVRVLFMSGESGGETLRSIQRRVMKAKGIDPSDERLRDLLLTTDLPQFNSNADLSALEKIIAGSNVQVVVIDPAYACMLGGGSSSLQENGALLYKIGSIVATNSATLVILTHAKKTIRDGETPKLADMAGAGYAEFARQWLLVNRRKGGYQYDGKHAFKMVVGGSAGHQGAYMLDIDEGDVGEDNPPNQWKITQIESLAKVARLERIAALKSKTSAYEKSILEALKASKEPLTKTRIRSLANVPNNAVGAVLDLLVSKGQAARTEKKRGSRTHQVYTIAS